MQNGSRIRPPLFSGAFRRQPNDRLNLHRFHRCQVEAELGFLNSRRRYNSSTTVLPSEPPGHCLVQAVSSLMISVATFISSSSVNRENQVMSLGLKLGE